MIESREPLVFCPGALQGVTKNFQVLMEVLGTFKSVKEAKAAGKKPSDSQVGFLQTDDSSDVILIVHTGQVPIQCPGLAKELPTASARLSARHYFKIANMQEKNDALNLL